MLQITRPTNTRQLRWFLALPKLGIVLLLAAVIALLWMLHQNELEEERAGLIKDVLWLEQNLRFQLTGNEERLQQLAADLGGNTDRKRTFRLRAGHILANNPEISHLLWLDAKRTIINSLPAGESPDSEMESFGPAITQKTFELAQRLGKAPLIGRSEPSSESSPMMMYLSISSLMICSLALRTPTAASG